MILEVMGRDAGWIALHAGLAGAADVILIPEIPYRIHAVEAKIEERAARGQSYSLVVVAEGAVPEGGQPSWRLADAGDGHPAPRRRRRSPGARARAAHRARDPRHRPRPPAARRFAGAVRSHPRHPPRPPRRRSSRWRPLRHHGLPARRPGRRGLPRPRRPPARSSSTPKASSLRPPAPSASASATNRSRGPATRFNCWLRRTRDQSTSAHRPRHRIPRCCARGDGPGRKSPAGSDFAGRRGGERLARLRRGPRR